MYIIDYNHILTGYKRLDKMNWNNKMKNDHFDLIEMHQFPILEIW